MEVKVAELTLRVGTLEERLDKHEEKDEKFHKYNSHMLEDLLARITGIERTAARFEADLTNRSVNDTNMSGNIKEIFDRLRSLERLAYIAIGAIIILGGLWTTIGVRLVLEVMER